MSNHVGFYCQMCHGIPTQHICKPSVIAMKLHLRKLSMILICNVALKCQ